VSTLADAGPLIALIDRGQGDLHRVCVTALGTISGPLVTMLPCRTEAPRIRALIEAYADTPMDLADASLVAAAETRGLRRVFSLDSDFRVYRIYGVTPFEVVP